ncbi:E3 ubiquitin-protein ligase TRIM38-like [Mytilus edulis]|uniref:E3 ubiquitin-protein ligase TRIM38-like n=1 Tax=Mytilus edulis TaxID=6550 RepID=UPI0039F07778
MAQAASKTCEICVSAPGSWYCLDCEQLYCENCKILHARQKLSTNHQFEKASDFIPEVKSKCTDHNEDFTFVCLACDVTVCVYCVTEKHNGHKLSHLKDIIVQLKSKFEEDISTKINKARGNVYRLEHNLSAFNGQVETVIKSITEEGNKLKSMIDRCTAKRIASLQEKARYESKRLSAILSDHKIAVENANALNNRKISIEEQSRIDGSLIKMLKTLNEGIDELGVSLPEFPSATYTPKVVNENDISQLLGTYQLCETKTGTEKKSETILSSRAREPTFECPKCGARKKKCVNGRYERQSFTRCHRCKWSITAIGNE